MTLIATVPLIVGLIGGLLYVFAGNAKLQEMGRLLFFAGMFVFLWTLAGNVLRIGR